MTWTFEELQKFSLKHNGLRGRQEVPPTELIFHWRINRVVCLEGGRCKISGVYRLAPIAGDVTTIQISAVHNVRITAEIKALVISGGALDTKKNITIFMMLATTSFHPSCWTNVDCWPGW